MAREWRDATLDQLGRIITGKTPTSRGEGYFGGDIPFVTPTDFDGRRLIDSTGRYLTEEGALAAGKSRIPAGAVMVSCIGSDMGKAAIAGQSCVTNQQINSLVVESGDDPMFVYYNLSTRKAEIRAAAGGSAQPILNKSSFGRMEIRLPPRDEQSAIAHVLGMLDDKIELNRRMNETLEAMARALFKSWFVNFDPVRAKVEGRDPGLPKHIADLFPDSFEDSALGEIPRGWKVGMLQSVLSELEVGGRPKGGVSSYTEGVPSIGAESIIGLGRFEYSKTKYIPRSFFDSMKKGHIKNRDVLLYKDGGRPGEYEPHLTLVGNGFPFSICAINEHVYRLRAESALGQNYLFFWLSSDLVMDEMRIKGTGVAIPGLNSTQVKSLITLVPSLRVTGAFDAIVDPIIARILSGCSESRTLANLRDTLLPNLISGELSAAHPPRAAEDVA